MDADYAGLPRPSAPTTQASLRETGNAFTQIAETVTPAVVSIRGQQRIERREMMPDFAFVTGSSSSLRRTTRAGTARACRTTSTARVAASGDHPPRRLHPDQQSRRRGDGGDSGHPQRPPGVRRRGRGLRSVDRHRGDQGRRRGLPAAHLSADEQVHVGEQVLASAIRSVSISR